MRALGKISSLHAGYDFTKEDFGSLAYHRIVETFKFAYGQRLHLGDPAFNQSILEEVPYVEKFRLYNQTARLKHKVLLTLCPRLCPSYSTSVRLR